MQEKINEEENQDPSKWEKIDLEQMAQGHITFLSKLLEDTQKIKELLLEKKG